MPSEMMERFNFYERNQLENESISNYCSALQELSMNCNFGGYLMTMLRDRLVMGLRSPTIRLKLLSEQALTYKKAKTIALSMESDLMKEALISQNEISPTCIIQDNFDPNKKSFSYFAYSKKLSIKQAMKTLPRKGESFTCGICEKVFTRKARLLIHRRIHTNEKPFSCERCDKSFSDESNLRRHVLIHTYVKPYVCDVCDKTFKKRAIFLKHKSTHKTEKSKICEICKNTFIDGKYCACTKETTFFCEICNKVFEDLSKFKKHSYIHSSGKRFICGICKKAFISRSKLLRHKNTHLNKKLYKNGKPFVCPVCNKGYSDKPYFLKHLRLHANYKPHPFEIGIPLPPNQECYVCGICNKVYGCKDELEKHYILHSILKSKIKSNSVELCNKVLNKKQDAVDAIDKPFSCEICNQTFSLKRNLLQHYRGHSKKTFSCDACKLLFNSRIMLMRHRLRTHRHEKFADSEKRNKN